jgi:hypothetical protein
MLGHIYCWDYFGSLDLHLFGRSSVDLCGRFVLTEKYRMLIRRSDLFGEKSTVQEAEIRQVEHIK